MAKQVQDTHTSPVYRELHASLLRIVGVMNRPQRDGQMVADAGISLDRALFPLLVLVDRLGPIAVGELADRVGRDYTTVSRQIAKMDGLGLVTRRTAAHDRRVTEATITEAGRDMNRAVDAARGRLADRIFAGWEPADVQTLASLMARFARDLDAS